MGVYLSVVGRRRLLRSRFRSCCGTPDCRDTTARRDLEQTSTCSFLHFAPSWGKLSRSYRVRMSKICLFFQIRGQTPNSPFLGFGVCPLNFNYFKIIIMRGHRPRLQLICDYSDSPLARDYIPDMNSRMRLRPLSSCSMDVA